MALHPKRTSTLPRKPIDAASPIPTQPTPHLPIDATPSSFTPYTTLITQIITSPPFPANAQILHPSNPSATSPDLFPISPAQHAYAESSIPSKWRPMRFEKKYPDLEVLFFSFVLVAGIVSIWGFKICHWMCRDSSGVTMMEEEDEEECIWCWDCITPEKKSEKECKREGEAILGLKRS